MRIVLFTSKRVAWLSAIIVAMIIAAIVSGAGRQSAASDAAAHHGHDMGGSAMNADAMRLEIENWYAQHPPHGGTLAAAVDTFSVISFRFDNDGSAATQIDTAKIFKGESVLFQWSDGDHTTTSGAPGQPGAGALWDHPIDALAGNQEFTVTLDTVGTFPFFCRPHGSFFNMKGVIVVSAAVDVPTVPPAASQIGFIREPSPNPTRGESRFRFALPQSGRTRVDVFDAGGRRVATPIDRDLDAGAHDAMWDGRAGEAPARAGIYYIRLTGPGVHQSRQVTVAR
jgi:plastocyanin